jgi:hypothetical protein
MKSSFDNLSRALQTVNGGEGVSLQAAYAGSIFVALLSRDPDKFQASVDALSRTITLLTSQIDAINVFSPVVGPRIYNRLKTLEKWVDDGEFSSLHRSKDSDRGLATMRDHIAAPDDPESMLRMNPVINGTLRLSLLVTYSELSMVTLNHPPHVFSIRYLYFGLVSVGPVDESKRSWHSIQAVCNDHRKELAITRNFRKTLGLPKSTYILRLALRWSE